jgi:hypothetical protein
VDKAVARLNIEHFHKLLATEQDESRRQTLRRLLAEEEAKLETLTDPPNDQKRRG